MSWYLLAWRKSFDFKGRARRKEYWSFTLFYTLCVVCTVVLDILFGTYNPRISMGWLTVGFLLAAVVPLLAVSARRLHDVGRSAWWLLLNLVPGFGSAALSVIALFDSQPGSNAFGINPKEAHEESTAVDFRSGKRQGKSLIARLFKAAVIVVAVVLFVFGGAWFWWQQNTQELLASGQVHRANGIAAGRTLDEAACVASAAAALRDEAANSMAAGIANSVELSGCLEASRVSPEFCDGIPANTEMLATVQWIASVCNQLGQGGNTSCNTMVQRIPEYCTSAVRQKKVGADTTNKT
jgi:uncharacterized membrane protein YhaH (DUF805 family)